MIDFHSHILPGIDDGSRDAEESLRLMAMLREQGCDTVVATPHFIPSRDNLDDFLFKRERAYELIKNSLPNNMPDILLGAEVAFYDGISSFPCLERLCIGESRLLLIEMPMLKWSERNIRELIEISCCSQIRPVLAHVERYLRLQSRDTVEKLIYNDILIQANASFFANRYTAGKAIKLLAKGKIHLIGSDCHNIHSRPPQLDSAYTLIKKRLGGQLIDQLENYSRGLLSDSLN